MPFRSRFDCLWCGQPHQVRSPDDLEGWASLCPDCLGHADDNGFLRARLRDALRARAAAAQPSSAPAQSAAPVQPVPAAHAVAHDDWYLRRGRFSRGPLSDGPWQMELDEVTRWVDALPISGVIVELAAGTGWWSPLLAGKGELWVYDSDEQVLEAARGRLVAHRLLAHLHVRDPLAPADRQADAVFASYLLGGAADAGEMRRRLQVMAGWLKPGGQLVVIEAAPAPGDVGVIDGPRGPLWPRDADSLRLALVAASLEPLEIRTSLRTFVMGRAASVIDRAAGPRESGQEA
jgi:SAM-dependent methyltransferase